MLIRLFDLLNKMFFDKDVFPSCSATYNPEHLVVRPDLHNSVQQEWRNV